MNNIIFFDSEEHNTLLPLTYTRPVSALRVGITTIEEKWKKIFGLDFSHLTQPYLQKKFALNLSSDNLFILGGLLPSDDVISAISELKQNQTLVKNGRILAARSESLKVLHSNEQTVQFLGITNLITRPWDIFKANGTEISEDLKRLKPAANNAPEHTMTIGPKDQLFIHPSAKVYAASLNTTDGPIYLGENTEIMEGANIRGPFALCSNSTVKMGAKIYGATTIGPYSKVGGEIGNSVILGYSNKGHDGYIGNSLLGHWCNLGADTNSSNLKNNYSEIRVWDYVTHAAINSGETFCGLIMGDHSKTGINTMLNTGTVVGVGANVYGASFPPKFIPSFSWGTKNDFSEYNLNKFLQTAEQVMLRRKIEIDEIETDLLKEVFSLSAKFRVSY